MREKRDPRVMIRIATRIEGDLIYHDEVPSTFEHAESLVGRRLDRRRRYCIIQDQVCEAIAFSDKCSGCSDGDPYKNTGIGCKECGYTGRKRQGHWIPLAAEVVHAAE